jgi:PAS domain S-box-containing protein
MKLSIEARTAVGFGTAFILVFLTGAIAYRNAIAFIDTSSLVSHTLDVLEEIEATLSSISSAESEQRGYIITGDVSYLDTYDVAYRDTNDHLATLRQLTADNDIQQAHLDRLGPTVSQRFDILEQGIDLRRMQGFAVAQEYIASGLGRQFMLQIQTVLGDMKAAENMLLAERTESAENSAQSTRRTFTILTYSILGLILVTYLMIRRDIRHRQKAEQAVTYERDLLQSLIDNIPDNIYFKDTASRFIRINRASARFFNLASVKDAIGKTDFDFQPPDLAKQFFAEEQHIVTSKQATVERIEFNPHPDGRTRWLSSTKVPISNAGGEVIGIVGISRDITSRKLAEDEINKLNENLKRRTADLQAKNQELEAFSYSVSHDLRTPLRSIDGFSQALLEDYSDRLDNMGQSYLHRVRAATQRMSQIIDDLLELSRVTRAEMKHDEVNLSALARQIADELQKMSDKRQAEFVIAKSLTVVGDGHLLRIALENLMGNAWKFSEQRPEVHIEFGSTTQPDGQKVYFVRDNGVGFDMTYIDKLFGAFQRLHSTTEFPGTGIGLATVERIIRRHNGRIWAEGTVNKGATFYFTLQ